MLLDDGMLGSGAVINAAGPWAKYLAGFAGLDMPIRAAREQDTIRETRPGRPMATTPVANAVDAAYGRLVGQDSVADRPRPSRALRRGRSRQPRGNRR